MSKVENFENIDFVTKKTERGKDFIQTVDSETGWGRATHRKAIRSPLTDSIEKEAQKRWDRLQKKAEETNFSDPSVGEALTAALCGAAIGTFMPVVVMFPGLFLEITEIGIQTSFRLSKENKMLKEIEKEYNRNKRRRG